jgi:hypothetical protein
MEEGIAGEAAEGDAAEVVTDGVAHTTASEEVEEEAGEAIDEGGS